MQRAIGNRAVGRLARSPQPTSRMLQRDVMSLADWKAVSKAAGKGKRPSGIKAVDDALAKYNAQRTTGYDATPELQALTAAITAWLQKASNQTSPARAAVLQLQQDVAAENPGGLAIPAGQALNNPLQVDGWQFKINAANRVIERVQRDPATGNYTAIGRVTGFQGNMPIVHTYANAVPLGNWRPEITHVNGMSVTPRSGILSAVDLQKAVGEAAARGGPPAPVDLLYTYSATLGFGGDVIGCVGGKLGMADSVTELQVAVMMAAVKERRRVTVSAHSRGTIKTDNAVRLAHARLTAREVAGGTPLKFAKIAAAADMNQYIQLIYAGNAVSYPSKILKIKMFVGGWDPVSIGFGTYTKGGARWASGNEQSALERVSGWHGFTLHYAQAVGKAVREDIALRQ